MPSSASPPGAMGPRDQSYLRAQLGSGASLGVMRVRVKTTEAFTGAMYMCSIMKGSLAPPPPPPAAWSATASCRADDAISSSTLLEVSAADQPMGALPLQRGIIGIEALQAINGMFMEDATT